jgi:glycyl-tRNA synthetase
MFIVKKKIGNEEYYYLRESKRVGSKVKAITVAYLGKDKDQADKKFKEILKSSTIKDPTKKPIKDPKNSQGSINKPKETNEEKDFLSFLNESGLLWGPSPEIYGGLAGFYTYGPLGKLLKNKVENAVRSVFTQQNFKEIEGPTILPDTVWKASGHLDTFNDPIIYTKDKKENYRADKLLEDQGIKITNPSEEKILELLKKHNIKAPNGKPLEQKIEKQSLMLKTQVSNTPASLRPETATVTYLPFLRIYNHARKKLPLSVFQIGKAYRNEISPRQHVLRGREFTQAEGQIFIDPEQKNAWPQYNEISKEKLPFFSSKDQIQNNKPKSLSIDQALKNSLISTQAYAWALHLAYSQFLSFGIPKERIRLRQHHPEEMAFYADDAWDIEVKLNNYSWIEMCGVHDRTNYDLKQHSEHSNTELLAHRENGEKFTPHIIEIAFGIDRPIYALIDLFYSKKAEKEGKTTFNIPYRMAPIDVSIFPLQKKPELLSLAKQIKNQLETQFIVEYDESGSIGRRYLRSATQGTPYAITVDFDALENKEVTIRDRNTEKQIHTPIASLNTTLKNLLAKPEDFKKAGKPI